MISEKMCAKIMGSRLAEEYPKAAVACINAIEAGVSPCVFNTVHEWCLGYSPEESMSYSSAKSAAASFDKFMQMHSPAAVGAMSSGLPGASEDETLLLSIPGNNLR